MWVRASLRRPPQPPPARFIRATWEDVDVDDGEGVCVYVDDDVDAEQRHAELRAQLSDERRHGLRAGRREVGHLLIQLGGRDEQITPGRRSWRVFFRSRTYRCEIRAGLGLGHLMAVEENGLSVWKRSE